MNLILQKRNDQIHPLQIKKSLFLPPYLNWSNAFQNTAISSLRFQKCTNFGPHITKTYQFRLNNPVSINFVADVHILGANTFVFRFKLKVPNFLYTQFVPEAICTLTVELIWSWMLRREWYNFRMWETKLLHLKCGTKRDFFKIWEDVFGHFPNFRYMC